MQIIDNLIIMLLHVLCFYAGMKIANYYNEKALSEKKDALERQYLRLRTRSDADDPCRPYSYHVQPQFTQAPAAMSAEPGMSANMFTDMCSVNSGNTGDCDGDSPIGSSFMDELRNKGVAKTKFRKSDLTKPV